jgi:hypothetical protein
MEKIKIKMPTTIVRINGTWDCPYCHRSFKNRRSNLRNHLLSQLGKRKSGRGTLCSKSIKSININILEEQIKNLVKVGKFKKQKKPDGQIRKFRSIDISTNKIESNWRDFNLETLVFKLIKATYTSDMRWRDNCIVTYGKYYKIKQKYGKGCIWSKDWYYKGNDGKYKSTPITDSFFTRLIIKNTLDYLKLERPAQLLKLLNKEDNVKFYDNYKNIRSKCSMSHQHKLKLMFLKRRRKKLIKVVETIEKEFESSDSDEDIETRPPSPKPVVEIESEEEVIKEDFVNHYKWLDNYNELDNNKLIKNVLCRVVEAHLNNRIDVAEFHLKQLSEGACGGNEKGSENIEFVISKLADGDFKNKLIKWHYDNYIDFDFDL